MDNYPVDSTELRGRGTKGVMSAVAGLGLLGVNALIHIPIVGWILGGILVVVGIGQSKLRDLAGQLPGVEKEGQWVFRRSELDGRPVLSVSGEIDLATFAPGEMIAGHALHGHRRGPSRQAALVEGLIQAWRAHQHHHHPPEK